MQRLLRLPDALDTALTTEAAKQSKKLKRVVTVQELIITATAAAYGVKIEIRGRGQRGPGRKGSE